MRQIVTPFGVTALLLLATLTLDKVSQLRNPATLDRPLETIDMQIAGWEGTANVPFPDRIVDSLKASSLLNRTYRKGSKSLELFIAFYEQQRSGGQSMHSPKHCLPGVGWEPLAQGTVDVPVAGKQIPIQRYTVQKGSSKTLVLYWYQSRQRIVASEYAGKIYLVWDSIVHRQAGGAIVRLVLPDSPGALEDGLAFASEIIPKMQRCLGYPDETGL